MIRKDSQLEKALLDSIRSGHFRIGERIPSRNQLAKRFLCSRNTVERAVASLKERGILTSSRGSGTFVCEAAPSEEIRELRVISPGDPGGRERSLENVLLERGCHELPVRWIPVERAETELPLLCTPGGAVIWCRPEEAHIFLMNHLAAHRVPQLLINRDYSNFDCIATDPYASIREGLSWLMIEGGRELAFITRRPSMQRPYLSSRIIAFYENAAQLGARLQPDFLFSRDFTDAPGELSEIAARLWGTEKKARAVFLMDQELALGLILAARNFDCMPGRDFYLLCFDEPEGLKNCPGTAMMRQPYELFHQELSHYLKHLQETSGKPFRVFLKTELVRGCGVTVRR